MQVFVIYESANPHMAILGRLPGTAVYRNIRQYPDAVTYPGKKKSEANGGKNESWIYHTLSERILSNCGPH